MPPATPEDQAVFDVVTADLLEAIGFDSLAEWAATSTDERITRLEARRLHR